MNNNEIELQALITEQERMITKNLNCFGKEENQLTMKQCSIN